ncbi:UNVERIFIED_CONTAM: hypothetical protein RMT77_012364 [Armadillidium vulgare]
MDKVWSTDNPLFCKYIFYSSILALKMFFMAPMTSFYRRTKLVWINPEDAARRNVKIKPNDEDVERVRRAHRNDIENIVPFWVLGLLFLQTNPSSLLTLTCFRLFTLSRILHSVAYLAQQSFLRSVLFTVGFFINIFMAVYTILYI